MAVRVRQFRPACVAWRIIVAAYRSRFDRAERPHLGSYGSVRTLRRPGERRWVSLWKWISTSM